MEKEHQAPNSGPGSESAIVGDNRVTITPIGSEGNPDADVVRLDISPANSISNEWDQGLDLESPAARRAISQMRTKGAPFTEIGKGGGFRVILNPDVAAHEAARAYYEASFDESVPDKSVLPDREKLIKEHIEHTMRSLRENQRDTRLVLTNEQVAQILKSEEDEVRKKTARTRLRAAGGLRHKPNEQQPYVSSPQGERPAVPDEINDPHSDEGLANWLIEDVGGVGPVTGKRTERQTQSPETKARFHRLRTLGTRALDSTVAFLLAPSKRELAKIEQNAEKQQAQSQESQEAKPRLRRLRTLGTNALNQAKILFTRNNQEAGDNDQETSPAYGPLTKEEFEAAQAAKRRQARQAAVQSQTAQTTNQKEPTRLDRLRYNLSGARAHAYLMERVNARSMSKEERRRLIPVLLLSAAAITAVVNNADFISDAISNTGDALSALTTPDTPDVARDSWHGRTEADFLAQQDSIPEPLRDSWDTRPEGSFAAPETVQTPEQPAETPPHQGIDNSQEQPNPNAGHSTTTGESVTIGSGEGRYDLAQSLGYDWTPEVRDALNTDEARAILADAGIDTYDVDGGYGFANTGEIDAAHADQLRELIEGGAEAPDITPADSGVEQSDTDTPTAGEGSATTPEDITAGQEAAYAAVADKYNFNLSDVKNGTSIQIQAGDSIPAIAEAHNFGASQRDLLEQFIKQNSPEGTTWYTDVESGWTGLNQGAEINLTAVQVKKLLGLA